MMGPADHSRYTNTNTPGGKTMMILRTQDALVQRMYEDMACYQGTPFFIPIGASTNSMIVPRIAVRPWTDPNYLYIITELLSDIGQSRQIRIKGTTIIQNLSRM